MSSSQFVRYNPALFEVLGTVGTLPPHSKLRRRSFVDWYYGSSDFGQLTLVLDGQQKCQACLGKELMKFQIGQGHQTLACLSSFYSLRNGCGFYDFAAVLKGCDAGLMLGATAEARRFAERLKWSQDEVPTYCLNVLYRGGNSHPLRAACKAVVNVLSRKLPLGRLRDKLPGEFDGLQVKEQAVYGPDLLNFDSAFAFRWEPSVSHLAWRYPAGLSFARYRLFRAFMDGKYAGYVILQDMPDQVLVAQCDGNDPSVLGAAIVGSISAIAGPGRDTREVMLLSSSPPMQSVLEAVGFRRTPRRNRVVRLGNMKGPIPNPVPMTEWLVNFDIGDRGVLNGSSGAAHFN